VRCSLVIAALSLFAACGDDAPPIYTAAELRDPTICQECHPKHFEQWAGSMHAYASEDPVFVAMNKRGQRETAGKLGDFCVKCHAPMAVELGLTDGSNFDPTALPAEARGITCYFCHNVKAVEGTHNNPLVLAHDQTMRGGLEGPVHTPAHRSAYNVLMDSDLNESEMCGSCHDIVVPASINGTRDVAVERTFSEWQTTFFATDKSPGIHLTCGACHMNSSTEVIADAPGLSVKSRPNGFHAHTWPGIDQALTPFSGIPEQAAAIKDILDPSIDIIGSAPLGAPSQAVGGICVTPMNEITVRVDSINVGHAWPSGAAQDRRAWVELRAYDAMNNLIFESGVVPDGVDPEQIGDSNLFGFWDKTFKADNTPAHFFWEIDHVDSAMLLRPPVTNDQTSPLIDHSTTKRYRLTFNYDLVERVEARVRIRALPYEVIDLLIASDNLAPAVRTALPTLDIAPSRKVWLKANRDPATFCCNKFNKCRP
jgi:hypothetical protein